MGDACSSSVAEIYSVREPHWRREAGEFLPFSQLTKRELSEIAAGRLVPTPPVDEDFDYDTDVARRWAQALLGT